MYLRMKDPPSLVQAGSTLQVPLLQSRFPNAGQISFYRERSAPYNAF